ncbi:hypothetical protein [Rhizobium leguminosarum]
MKDVLGVGFSTTALILSIVGFYISNVKVQDSVIAKIVDLRVDAVTMDDHVNGYKNGVIVAQMSFIDNGNRSAIIMPPWYQISGTADRSGGSFGDVGETNKDKFPVVIQPGEIKLIELHIPVTAFLSNLQEGVEPKDDPNNHDHSSGAFTQGLISRSSARQASSNNRRQECKFK